MDEILCEGFLTKSPPEKKINRARWHQRWFVLRRLRGTYILEYYKDKNSVTPKGTIKLQDCEQVDQGLTFESKKFDQKDAYIFDIVTSKRKFFLVSRTEEDMIRWVRSICEVCGFHLEQDEENEDDENVAQPMTIHNLPHEPISNLYTDTPMRDAPAQQSNGNLEDGYFELSDSVSGPNNSTTDVFLEKGLPAKLSGRDSGVATLDEPIDRESFGSSGSSVPSESAPPPPPKSSDRRTSLDGPHDIYDTPPFQQSQRHSLISESGAIYDCPPVQRRRPSEPVEEMDESEALYKQVPPPRRSVTSSIDFPVSPMKNGYEDSGACDIYDVPPVKLPSTQQLYDTPPVVKHEELSQSTDNLAKTFQNISFRNSMGNSSINSDTFDIYDIPGSNNNDFGQDRGPVSPPMDAAPPRPPKPTHMQMLDPTTPPPSFDDTYNIPLNLQPQLNHTDLTNRLSQEAQGHENYETPPSWNHSGHSWMDSNNAAQSKPRYINTKRTDTSGMPVNRSRTSLDGAIPAPSPNSYINTRNERYTFSPKQSPHTQSCYLPMQGNSNFEFDDPYMPMEGAVDGLADSYTLMQSPLGPSDPPPIVPSRSKSVSSARNSLGELPPPIPRSMSTSSRSSRNSQGEIPPPVNRHSKPIDRWSTSSSMSGISSPDLTAATGAGSFYATPEDAYEVQGSIVASARTQSFSKKGMPMIPPQKPGESLRDSIIHENFRQRTNTGGSTTSSSGESGVIPPESHYVTPTDGLHQPTIQDEVYVYKDPPPVTPQLEKEQAAAKKQTTQAPKDPPTFESIAEASIPPPAPVVDTGKIEYLELDHTKNEETPPPRPPKPVDATTVEYFDLDPQKTKALQDVTAERQKNLSSDT